jgi:hypothetical protein
MQGTSWLLDLPLRRHPETPVGQKAGQAGFSLELILLLSLMAIRFIFAPDLLASLRWYIDILNLPPDAMQADPPTLRLSSTDTLVFSEKARPGAHILPVESADAARQRFEYRPRVPGENQGRIVAASPGHLSLIDPANNELTLFEIPCEEPPA